MLEQSCNCLWLDERTDLTNVSCWNHTVRHDKPTATFMHDELGCWIDGFWHARLVYICLLTFTGYKLLRKEVNSKQQEDIGFTKHYSLMIWNTTCYTHTKFTNPYLIQSGGASWWNESHCKFWLCEPSRVSSVIQFINGSSDWPY